MSLSVACIFEMFAELGPHCKERLKEDPADGGRAAGLPPGLAGIGTALVVLDLTRTAVDNRSS